MKRDLRRRHLAIFCSATGIALMGVDLLLTRNFFSHIGELMALSVIFLAAGIVLDRQPKAQPRQAANATSDRPLRRARR